MSKVTQSQTIAIVRSMGLSCRFSRDWGNEYRVAPMLADVQARYPELSRNEAIARIEGMSYYSDCPHDTVNTAKTIALAWDKV